MISTRLVLVSLVVGVVLAGVSVPASVALAEWGPTWTPRLTGVEVFVHEGTKAYYVRRARPTGTMWLGFDGMGDVDPALGGRGMTPDAFAGQMGAALVPSSPLPDGADALLAGPANSVEYHSNGWPWRIAWGVHTRQYQPAQASDFGLWQLPAFGTVLTIPTLPLWPGLLGNTLFYTLLMLIPIVLWRYFKLRRRARRGLCLACAYDLGEGIAACPECGLARAEVTR